MSSSSALIRVGCLFGFSLLTACVIPPDLDVAYPGQQYRGECDCTLCFERDASNVCIDERVSDFDVFACSYEPEFLDDDLRNQIVIDLGASCLQDEVTLEEILGDMNASCQLDANLNPTGMGAEAFFVPQDGGACPEIIEPLSIAMPSEGVGAQVATFNSFVIVSDPDFNATIEVLGSMSFSGANCSFGTCPITLHRLELTSDEFEVTAGSDTILVTDAVITNTTEGTGSCFSLAPLFPNTCGFIFNTGTLEVIATGVDEDGNSRMLTMTNDQPGGGVINFTTQEILLNEVFFSGDTTIEFGLHGTVDNFAPRVVLPSASVACGRGLTLTAIVEDVDGNADQVDLSWYIDGQYVARGSTSVTVDLEPGTHEVSVVATDPAGGFSGTKATIDVAEDVTPPEIVEGASVCLWPANHELIVVASGDVTLLAVDDCDPNPTLVFTSGESSQPDNANGDGNTTQDLVVQPESVCVRSERQGTESEGRTYSVGVVAIDAAGNVSGETDALMITVPHDQSPDGRCTMTAGTPAEEDDPRCVPVDSPADGADGRGCSSTALDGGALLLVGPLGILALGLRRRRRAP